MTQNSERSESQINEVGAQRLLAASRALRQYNLSERQVSELIESGELDYFFPENISVPEEIVKEVKNRLTNRK